jgi:hypothetical protein
MGSPAVARVDMESKSGLGHTSSSSGLNSLPLLYLLNVHLSTTSIREHGPGESQFAVCRQGYLDFARRSYYNYRVPLSLPPHYHHLLHHHHLHHHHLHHHHLHHHHQHHYNKMVSDLLNIFLDHQSNFSRYFSTIPVNRRKFGLHAKIAPKHIRGASRNGIQIGTGARLILLR